MEAGKRKGEKGKEGGEREGAQRERAQKEEVREGLLMVLDCISWACIISFRAHSALI